MSLSPAIHLKRLTLHGFKTFASRTTFEFRGGITAVIGPNGSGKSNLADGVRWVLGETSQTALRSKKTEDIIFAGSSRRTPLGMAEVSLTIDNSGGLLDSEFAEVTITRRAYRDGENQYLINGNRVRLRDLASLTAPLGSAYTVVGQGLVDVALSQRPEERRGLFEHAAGIAGHQLKRSEAERRLAATEANCQRLTDILGELTPRLRTLERQARQAGEAASVQAQLTAALRSWYGAQWRTLAAAVAAATEQADHQQTAVETARRLVTDREAARQQRRDQLAGLSGEREALQEERRSLSERRAAAERQAAVATERVAALQRQLAASDDDAAGIAARRDQLADQLTATTADLATLDADHRQAAAAVAAAVTAATGEERAAQQAARETGQLRQRLLTGATDLGRQETELARLHERQAALGRERQALTATAAEQTAQQVTLRQQQAQLTSALSALAAERQALEARQAAQAQHLTEHEATARQLRRQRDQLDHDLTAARARLEALTRLRESGAGLAAGTRAVLSASRTRRLTGVLGAVTALISAPAALETAIEVALGAHLHDIVVERWADAEAAIAFLKQAGAGRATFQPLDTLRPPRAPTAPTGPGIIGLAARLVEHEARFRPLVESLLGRSLLVEDLASSQRLVRQGGGWTLVTLAGELTRPGGSVTGGSAVREAGLLARERELRELPRQLDRWRDQRTLADEQLTTLEDERAALANQAAALADQATQLARTFDQQTHHQARLTADEADLTQAIANATRQLSELDERGQQLARLIKQQATAVRAAQTEQAASQQQLAALTNEQLAIERRWATARATVDEARGRLVRLEERRRALHGRQAELTAERTRLTAAEQTQRERRATMRAALATAEREQGEQRQQQAQLATELAAVEQRAAPLVAALTTARVALEEDERTLAAASEQRLAVEAAAGRAAVAVEQARGALAALTARLEVDLPGVAPAELADEPAPAPQLAATISSLRERQRRIGLVDPAVVEEYAATRERYDFLTRELRDIEAAVQSLRTAIGELDELMRQRFSETFAAVNAAFGQTFGRLFNGGSARLLLTDDGEAPGVDILAQPPGKRPQSLALLSGGERALTAVALLFAILAVNPSPFCLLDEVDAALDESNVARFRDLLTGLARQTQFVVVTHNRGTIEGADTLYGITMSQDGVSQVISLHLETATSQEATARAADD